MANHWRGNRSGSSAAAGSRSYRPAASYVRKPTAPPSSGAAIPGAHAAASEATSRSSTASGSSPPAGVGDHARRTVSEHRPARHRATALDGLEQEAARFGPDRPHRRDRGRLARSAARERPRRRRGQRGGAASPRGREPARSSPARHGGVIRAPRRRRTARSGAPPPRGWRWMPRSSGGCVRRRSGPND